MNTVADRHKHAAYHNKQYSDKLLIGVNIDDLEWPWISKIGILVFFSNLWLQRRFQEWIASKWIDLNQDNLRIWTAVAVARVMSFAQITCIACCTLIPQVAAPMLSCVTWALFKLLFRLHVYVFTQIVLLQYTVVCKDVPISKYYNFFGRLSLNFQQLLP